MKVRSYEGDAWGQVPASGLLRYFEQSAINAAADAGYGSRFHTENHSAWVIRRMAMLVHTPPRHGDEMEITTWISHFARVRGGREYRLAHAETGQVLVTGLAEWVYLDRDTLAPLAIPAALAKDFDVPSAPLGTYEPPYIEHIAEAATRHVKRTAEWHETDSMGHVNNAIYADWLDDAFRYTMAELGWSTELLNSMGLQLRGEYYKLDYKKAAVPGDILTLSTIIEGASGRLCAVRQEISTNQGAVILASKSIYGWRTYKGEPVDAPKDWGL